MKTITYMFISLICISLGILIFALQKGWIIIRLPIKHAHLQNSSHNLTSKKTVQLYFWHNKKWQQESTQIIWTTDLAKNIELLINNWLTLLDEEQILEKKVILQSALITHSNYVYLSFDRSPFNKENSTHDKLLFLQGLFKTIKGNGVTVQGINFMVQHKPMDDTHLDFSNPWPLNGYLG